MTYDKFTRPIAPFSSAPQPLQEFTVRPLSSEIRRIKRNRQRKIPPPRRKYPAGRSSISLLSVIFPASPNPPMRRRSTGFTDSVFAEDIGRSPDTNIAESFHRIPGMTITRDIMGDDVNVAIRGWGWNFTNVTLNGAPIAVAPSGATARHRSIDFSFFPTDLFTKPTVNGSYAAHLSEGGAAGMNSSFPYGG